MATLLCVVCSKANHDAEKNILEVPGKIKDNLLWPLFSKEGIISPSPSLKKRGSNIPQPLF